MKTPAPIKRNKSLVPLSKEHHDGLLLVWKIKQGLHFKIEYMRIMNYILHVFEQELAPHFQQEETLLFSKLPQTDELRIKAETQHAAIRQQVAAFKTLPGTDEKTLTSFGKLLDEHIRFEERILFPHLEQQISSEELPSIGEELNSYYQNKEHTQWKDEFWIKPQV